MRKFKVIKEFPSPSHMRQYKIGDIIQDVGCRGMCDVAPNWPEYFEEIKEPLFVTEDGKKIFKGDISHGVRLSDFRIISIIHHDLLHYTPTLFKEFSTKEAAEKYIEQNKPRFSIKDIEDALEYIYTQSNYFPSIQILFKQKLGI